MWPNQHIVMKFSHLMLLVVVGVVLFSNKNHPRGQIARLTKRVALKCAREGSKIEYRVKRKVKSALQELL